MLLHFPLQPHQHRRHFQLLQQMLPPQILRLSLVFLDPYRQPIKKQSYLEEDNFCNFEPF